jgi:hypothetical protein
MTELEPFLSKYKLVVFRQSSHLSQRIPHADLHDDLAVVYLISNPALLESLVPSPDEVGAIFDIPLEYCLTAVWPGDQSLLSKKGSDDWPYEDEYYVSRELGSEGYLKNFRLKCRFLVLVGAD